MRDSLAERLGGFRLSAQLGVGGFGSVYRGEPDVGVARAVKVLHDRDHAVAFRREAETLLSLKHPNIVELVFADLESDPPFLVMELVEEGSLADRGPLEQGQALDVFRAILEGLAHAHSQGVAHLDLKPGNILLSSDGAKISDFGLARAIHSARGGLEHSQAETRRSLGSGTLAYMAPEQREGNLGDFRSDTFGLGLVLAKAITGRLPEPGDTLADLMRDPPAWASRLFERCHSRYERRFPSAVEALAVLLEETDKRRQLPKLVPLSGPPDPVRAGAQPLAPASVPPLAPPVQANPWRSGNVAVPFVLTNPQGLPADVHIRVSCDDGATWREATTITGTRSLRATLSGEPHTVLWNSVSDTGRRAVTVLVRVDVDGEKGTWVHTYHVDNRSAPEQTAERPSLWRLMWGRST